MKINVFVEGFDDQELIAAIITAQNKVVSLVQSSSKIVIETSGGNTVSIYMTEGWTNLRNVQPILLQTETEGVKNLVIYDADTTSHNEGGVVARRAELERQKADLGVEFELFLLPTNGAIDELSDGNLENLLEQLIQPQHQRVFDCFQLYEECLKQYRTPDEADFAYRIPASKPKIYAYVEAMRITKEEKKEHRRQRQKKDSGSKKFFANPSYWNLSAPELQPLYQFVDSNIE